MLVPVDPHSNAQLTIANFGLQMPKQRPRDFQRTTELVCKFIVDTTQLLNRLSAHCNDKLQGIARDLQRFEVQLRLLEYKLDSIEEEEGRATVAADERKVQRDQAAADRAANREARASGGGGGGGVAAIQGAAPGGGGGAGGPPGTTRQLAIGAPPGVGGGPNVPQMPSKGGYAPGNVPVPGAPGSGKAPPLPPGMTAKGAAAAPAVPAPPPPPMTKIVAQPPPFPLMAGMTTRKHPKLKGYFDMVDAGVPAAAVRARMTADGYKPEWLDIPHNPSPLPSMSAQEQKTFFDSD